jgi:single-strand DNA-binding protein
MINKVILMGRLGKDPMIKRLSSGRIVANVTLATNEVYQNAGVLKEITEWHQLEMWDKQAEFAEKYLKKGRVIYVDGKIKTEKYVDSMGVEKEVRKIRVTDVKFIDVQGRKENIEPKI